MNRSIWAGLLVLMIMLVMSTSAVAEEAGNASQAQLELNQQGVEAIIAEDYPRAVRLFEASLDLGALNITHLNMGRAYQHDGQCEKAEEHYGKALEAPRVETPTVDEIHETVGRYRDELRDNCPGYLEVSCDPPELSLYVDDDGPKNCAEESRLELMPGDYELRGEYQQEEASTSVVIEALRTSQVELGLDVVSAADPIGEGVPELEEPSTGLGEPWMWFAASAVALGAGIALDTVPDRASNYEFDAINLAPPGLYVGSATLAFFGVRELRR